MRKEDQGASLRDRAGGADAPEPAAQSQPKALIPSATLAEASLLIKHCECASEAGQPFMLRDVANFLFDPAKRTRVEDLICIGAYVDAAILLLPDGAIWRRYTDDTAAVYAASPYSANAQVRYDGLSRLPAMAICAAHLRMAEAALKKASAIETRRAETQSGSVHESAGPQDDAQPSPPPSSDPTP